MKRKILLLIIILVIIAVVICMYILGKQSYYKTDLPFEDDGQLMGIIQIGGSEMDYDYSVVDKYFKTREFETIEFGGTEKYLIIPRKNNIDVYSLELTEEGSVKEQYVTTKNNPFYITCNISDIISNSLLRITKDSKQYSYSPYISLKDGKLVVEDFVLHIQ